MNTAKIHPTRKLPISQLVVAGIVMIAFWTLAVVMWQTSGLYKLLFLFGFIGTSVGTGLGLYAILPKKHKTLGRRLSLFLIGTCLFGFAALYGEQNMQIEGVFFGLLTGVVQTAVFHYLVAKIFGPLLFGRLWCGWACWTAMILDLLPFKRSSGRLPGKWGWLRYAHFALSLGLVLVLWLGFHYGAGSVGLQAMYWFLAGNVLYYAVGIILAFVLKDNRAFCKYVCPVTVPLKLSSRFAMLKIKGDSAKCNYCHACEKMCPMDVRLTDYIKNGQRISCTECLLCQTCITVCARDALKLSFGADVGGKDLLRERSAQS